MPDDSTKSNGPPTLSDIPTRHDGSPTQPTRLPDFKPKGMSTIDKVCAWLLTFLIVITLIVFGNRLINAHIHNESTKPSPKATATAPVTPGATSTAKAKAGASCPL